MSKWYCYVTGRQYGPVDADELARWVAEYRLNAEDLVWSEGMDQWATAGTVWPAWFVCRRDPYPQPVRPHRGELVLTLGILSLVCCPIGLVLGIIAWVMATDDLIRMRRGQMDPRGQGQTRAGQICGIIAVAATVLGLLAHGCRFAVHVS
jgi:hypothetical protein